MPVGLLFPSKVPVKSKGQRHILSSRIFFSTFSYSDFCRYCHHTRKQWFLASDCVNREKVRQLGGRIFCLWGTLGVLSRGSKEKGPRFVSHSSLLRMNASLLFYIQGKNIAFWRETSTVKKIAVIFYIFYMYMCVFNTIFIIPPIILVLSTKKFRNFTLNNVIIKYFPYNFHK